MFIKKRNGNKNKKNIHWMPRLMQKLSRLRALSVGLIGRWMKLTMYSNIHFIHYSVGTLNVRVCPHSNDRLNTSNCIGPCTVFSACKRILLIVDDIFARRYSTHWKQTPQKRRLKSSTLNYKMAFGIVWNNKRERFSFSYCCVWSLSLPRSISLSLSLFITQ